jgi:branched-chain amino acid transport system ATP-binding protein
MTALLELNDVSVRYRRGARAVSGASLALEQGQCAVVVGPNGAGKTSLARSIAGFLKHEGVDVAGTIRFRGERLLGRNPSTIARLGIAYIPERDKVFRELTIRENLHVFTERRASKAGLDDDYDYVFELFPRLPKLPPNRPAGLLSGGEQQMLALAGALVARPSVMLVDEPSLGLAPILVSDVMATLHRIRVERDLALLLVDQNVRSTAHLATAMYTMTAGHLTHETGDDVVDRLAREGYSTAAAP